jgi:hypothetical protein
MDVVDRHMEYALGPKRRFWGERTPGKRRAFSSDEKGAICKDRKITFRMAGLMFHVPRFRH